MSEEETKPKHRARRKKEDKPTPAKGLLDALAFIKPCQKKKGTLEQTHCLIQANWMVASDGIMTIATPVQEDLTACPQSSLLEEALKKSKGELSITQLSDEALSVSSGSLKITVPCEPTSALNISGPDPQRGVADFRLKEALKDLAPIATEGAADAINACVLIDGVNAVATNNHLILEIEHGVNLPNNILVPKAACAAVGKCKKLLTGFGFSGSSCTFWFEDGSFIKTQLFDSKYPNYQIHLENEDALFAPIPESFFEAIAAVKDHSTTSVVYVKDSGIWSDNLESSYQVEGLIGDMGINFKYLTLVKSSIENICFDSEQNKLFFFDHDRRGMIMGVEKATEV